MRIKSEFILREVAGESILIPTGEAAKRLSGLIALNESARFLYEKLKTERTEEELVRAMLEGGTTVLLTTHYLEEAERLADRVVVIVGGRVAAEGTVTEVAGGRGLEDAYFALTDGVAR